MAAMRKDVSELTGPELDRLVRGFQALTALPASDQNSFATIATYHGIPAWYCQHGNVLFPLWHRAYIMRLERALRTVLNDDTFAMPFWNETSPSSARDGLPGIFTSKTYSWSDGSGSVANPLFSYKLQVAVSDGDNTYTKPEGYETVRYPWSGLVSDNFAVKTEEHNAKVAALGPVQVTEILNSNIVTWLTNETYINSDGTKLAAGEINKFNACLQAPNFTVFSNITSANAWNKQHPSSTAPVVVAVEEPHNALHLAIGGFDIPGAPFNASQYEFANGDMGDNETAAYDPVFYFHHCFIDYMFWKWQVLNGQTNDLPIPDPDFPGVDGNSLATDLNPFSALEVNGQDRPLQGKDIVDIETLGYSYPEVERRLHREHPIDAPKLAVTGISRKDISGSFLVTTWAKGEGDEPHRLLKVQPVLSRWNVAACKNCQEHLDVESHIHLVDFTHDEAEKGADEERFFTLIHAYGTAADHGKFADGAPIKPDLVTRRT